ncbi:hypothetical protein LSE82_005749 [Salmonella enterica]|nr:hypothetical protein [Salmonella enterica]
MSESSKPSDSGKNQSATSQPSSTQSKPPAPRDFSLGRVLVGDSDERFNKKSKP